VTAPLDPDSPRGQQLTDQLGDWLAQVRINIADRRAAAAARTATPERQAA